MSLYQRKDSSMWWIKLSVNGRRLQKSTGTDDRKAAQEYHDRLKAQLWEQSRLGLKPSRTWKEAVVRWLEETTHKASRETDLVHLRLVDPILGSSRLDDITRDKLEEVIQLYQARGLANATVNRANALIRAILRKAVFEWEWLQSMPKVRMLKEAKRRIRWITHREAAVLLDELPEHLEAMVLFSLETGLRQANVTGLEWSQIHLERKVAWVHPDQAKARKAIAVPLSDAALAVIAKQEGKHPTHVFTFRGRPVGEVNTKAWKGALKRAGIQNFRWHDLRHTWASWHVQRGTPLHVLQELGGWESVEMVRRYAHLSSEHLAGYVTNMAPICSGSGYESATVPEMKKAYISVSL